MVVVMVGVMMMANDNDDAGGSGSGGVGDGGGGGGSSGGGGDHYDADKWDILDRGLLSPSFAVRSLRDDDSNIIRQVNV